MRRVTRVDEVEEKGVGISTDSKPKLAKDHLQKKGELIIIHS